MTMMFHWYVDHNLMEFIFCQTPYPITQSQSTQKDATSSPVKPSKVNGAGKVKREVSGSMSVSDSEDVPKPKKGANGRSKRPPRKKVKEESDTSDDDEPLEPPKKRGPAGRKRKVKVEEDSHAEEEEPAKPKAAPKPRRKKVKQEEEQEEASGTEAPKPKISAKSKKAKVKEEESGSPVKGKGRKKEKKEEEGEEVFRWWEQSDPNGDGTVKWHTLEHHGVYFPPPYEPLPKGVKMKYNGKFCVQ